MSREIKFRCWDDITKEMVFPNDHIEPYKTALGIMIKHYDNLQQFTGLKDTNEKELYEGDIIDVHQTVNGQSKFLIKSILPKLDIRYCFDTDRKYEYDPYELLDFGKWETEIEIIGNLHENPELLTPKK
jgi:uncharacterized phage protein (TIGR01671 family)